MLASVNKAKFLVRKTLITLTRFRPCYGVNVGYRV